MSDSLRQWVAPVLASVGLVGLAATFVVEMGSFRSAVEEWAARDLAARTQLAAANLREPLATGDFRAIYAFGAACTAEGLRMTVFGAGGGLFYDSLPHGETPPECLYAAAPSHDFSVRLGIPRERVLAPFRRARFGFLLAALAGGAGMLLVFFFTYRQHVRIRELKRLEEFRRQFVADVSHELKTPLTGLLGASDLLGSSGGDAMQRKLCAMIAREAKRLDALAQGILDLARLERADAVMHVSRTNLTALVRDVVEAHRLQAQSARIALSGPADDAPEVVVNCDSQLIERAVANLVGNALKHSGSPEVSVSVGGGDREAFVVVEDHGRGIPSEHAARVFERFHRVDPARAAETGGAGLGLAIVRGIAQLHGGDVTLGAATPSGCRFVLKLAGIAERERK